MPYDISLCDSKGNELCGSDGHFNIDKRFGLTRIHSEVTEYRSRFQKNFPHKFSHWTHFKFRGMIHKI
jgi:hypothetical protein